MYFEVIPTKVFRKGATVLTYFSTIKLKRGHIVLVPLGRTSCPAIVSRSVKKPSFTCKPITKLLYATPLPAHLMQSLFWLSRYYLLDLPLVASLLLPIGVEKSRRNTTPQDLSPFIQPNSSLPLNQAQKIALKKLQAIPNPTKLLFGITGSGKTNIYLKLVQQTLNQGQSVILLVPEIALTSQLVQNVKAAFSQQVRLIHSKQTESSRHQIWESILTSTSPQIVIGPRSALFAPLSNLGLIIIDEAHESAYYQENAPRYSALRLASFIASSQNITCLLGTATPLVSDYYLSKTKRSLVTLSQKAKKTAIKPSIKIIDFTNKDLFTKSRYFSNPLLACLKSNLESGHQTLIYHNRRGSAPMTICENCGWQALCPHCFLPLTLHSDSYSLLCHACGYSSKIPSSCPECHHPSIIHKGFGTKLLETELIKLFPKARIARFDADNTKSNSLDVLYSEVKNGNIQIVIGTQAVSRGLDLPHLASIGIVQADSGLSLPDFAAEERTFELLTQVIGRVGRGHLQTASVFIQTYQPNSPVINLAIKEDYPSFYDYLIKKRRKQLLPPFCYLAKLTITYKTEQTTLKKIHSLSQALVKAQKSIPQSPQIFLSPPMPAFHEHSNSGFSWQVIVKSRSRQALLTLLSNIDPKFNAHLALDPPSLL